MQLADAGLLREPLLYVSLHFKEHRQTYYELLNRVRQTGDWEAWLDFFAEAAERSAVQSASAARRMLDIATADTEKIAALGRAAASALAVHRAMQRQPIATAASVGAVTTLSPATVNKSLAHLERLGVVTELTSRQRGRVFSYSKYVDILNEGLAPLAESPRA